MDHTDEDSPVGKGDNSKRPRCQNPVPGSSGGLSLGWNDSISVVLRSYSSSHIDVMIDEGDGTDPWRCTGFYGPPEVQNKVISWQLLRSLNDCPNIPWCVMGNFNEILSVTEKQGALVRNEWQIRNFCDTLQDCSLFDMGYRGN
ncbi:hypothetical protein V6N11_024353 [Hibiscus sabdariffa]|uniref:Uncharacterized protein n=1 Tax=Hibiscus sabdariffa TaxID=183260 RepID=A0ABR1ZUW1_9ROSI